MSKTFHSQSLSLNLILNCWLNTRPGMWPHAHVTSCWGEYPTSSSQITLAAPSQCHSYPFLSLLFLGSLTLILSLTPRLRFMQWYSLSSQVKDCLRGGWFSLHFSIHFWALLLLSSVPVVYFLELYDSLGPWLSYSKADQKRTACLKQLPVSSKHKKW